MWSIDKDISKDKLSSVFDDQYQLKLYLEQPSDKQLLHNLNKFKLPNLRTIEIRLTEEKDEDLIKFLK